MSERDLKRWMVYSKIEPFGEERMDMRFALMTAHLISPYMKKGCHAKLDDYMLKTEPRQMTNDDMKNVLMGMSNG